MQQAQSRHGNGDEHAAHAPLASNFMAESFCCISKHLVLFVSSADATNTALVIFDMADKHGSGHATLLGSLTSLASCLTCCGGCLLVTLSILLCMQHAWVAAERNPFQRSSTTYPHVKLHRLSFSACTTRKLPREFLCMVPDTR